MVMWDVSEADTSKRISCEKQSHKTFFGRHTQMNNIAMSKWVNEFIIV